MAQYMEKSKEWLISRNWSFVNYHMKEVVDDLTDLQDSLKPSYHKEELVKFLDLVLLQNNYELPITRINRLIDGMSESEEVIHRRLRRKRTHRRHK